MKIIHFILGKANPNRMNGVNKVVNNLATCQKELGYDVEVWGLTDDLTHNYPNRNYITRLFKKNKSHFIPKQVKDELKKTEMIFHLHGGFILEYYFLSRLLKKHKIDFIFTSHGSYNKEALKKNGKLKKLYFSLFEKRMLGRAKSLHFIGKSEYDNAGKLLKKVNRFIVPNGQNELSVDNEVKHNKFVFGFCGRIKKHVKGLDILLEGFADFLKINNSNAELWLIGDGEDLEAVKAITKFLRIENNVRFLGAKYGEEKDFLISQFNYFCHPSRYEGLPTAVLEAAALGIPSIVSIETNMGDYISKHDAGITLEINNKEYLCNAFNKAYSEKLELYQAKSDNAIKMIKEEFDWSLISQKLVNYYLA